MLRLAILVVCVFACVSNAYFVTVDANEEACFFDRAKHGDRLTLFFEVSEGGFYDIDVTVRSNYMLSNNP